MWVGALKAIFIFLFMNLFILQISYEMYYYMTMYYYNQIRTF